MTQRYLLVEPNHLYTIGKKCFPGNESFNAYLITML